MAVTKKQHEKSVLPNFDELIDVLIEFRIAERRLKEVGQTYESPEIKVTRKSRQYLATLMVERVK